MGGNQNTLTFTRSNWDTAQTVTVTADDDDVDAADDTASISPRRRRLPQRQRIRRGDIAAVAVTVPDDDTTG